MSALTLLRKHRLDYGPSFLDLSPLEIAHQLQCGKVSYRSGQLIDGSSLIHFAKKKLIKNSEWNTKSETY